MKRTGFLVLFSALVCGPAFACTGMYAGKAVSEDGTILLGRTVDTAPWTSCHMYVAEPRVENAPGRLFRSWRNGFRWDLPATTWKFVSTPHVRTSGRGRMDSACVNEKGLAIYGTVTGRAGANVAKIDPFVPDGTGEDSLPGLLIQCCATAEEALELRAAGIVEPILILGYVFPEDVKELIKNVFGQKKA